MNESFLESLLVCGILLCCQPHQSVLENVGFQRVKAGDEYVDSEVVFVSPEEVWLCNILLNQVAASLFVFDLVLLTNDLYSSAAACSSWLQNVHVFVVVHLSVVDPSFVVLWQDVSGGTDVELFALLSPLSLNVSPQVCLAAEPPRSDEVVDLLTHVHAFEPRLLDEGGPQTVPVVALHNRESGCFEGVDDTIVCVSLVAHFELQGGKLSYLVLRKNLKSVFLIRSLHFQERRIAEENGRLSARNRTILQDDCVVRRSCEKCLSFAQPFEFGLSELLLGWLFELDLVVLFLLSFFSFVFDLLGF
jgi:hypothetical protein